MLARTQAQPRAAVKWERSVSRPAQTRAHCSVVLPRCALCRILDKVELSVDDSWVHQVQLCGWNMGTHHCRRLGVSRGRMAFRSKAHLGLLCAPLLAQPAPALLTGPDPDCCSCASAPAPSAPPAC